MSAINHNRAYTSQPVITCSQEPNKLRSTITFYQHLYRYDADIIHIRINDILRSKDSNDLNDLPENVIKVGKIFQYHNIGKILYQE